MTTTLVIDTSVLVGIIDNRDTWHSHAVTLQSAIVELGASVVYFDPVINEAIGLLGRRLAEQRRHQQFSILLKQLQTIVPPNEITWISHRARHIYTEIVDLIDQHGGTLNFHDALIALSCRELGLTYLASFDRDFDAIPWIQRVSSPQQILK